MHLGVDGWPRTALHSIVHALTTQLFDTFGDNDGKMNVKRQTLDERVQQSSCATLLEPSMRLLLQLCTNIDIREMMLRYLRSAHGFVLRSIDHLLTVWGVFDLKMIFSYL